MLTVCALEDSSLRIALVYAQYGSRTCFQTSCKVTNHARFQPRVIFFYFQQMNVKMGHHIILHMKVDQVFDRRFPAFKNKNKASVWMGTAVPANTQFPPSLFWVFFLTHRTGLKGEIQQNQSNKSKKRKEKKITDLCIRTLFFFIPLYRVPLSDLFCDRLEGPTPRELNCTELHLDLLPQLNGSHASMYQ